MRNIKIKGHFIQQALYEHTHRLTNVTDRLHYQRLQSLHYQSENILSLSEPNVTK